jgi:hypothetical protein
MKFKSALVTAVNVLVSVKMISFLLRMGVVFERLVTFSLEFHAVSVVSNRTFRQKVRVVLNAPDYINNRH